jgi:hypothetical protein
MSEKNRRRESESSTAVPALREHVYATLIGLSTVLLRLPEAEVMGVPTAAVTFAATVGGLWAAHVFADLVAHSVVRNRPPTGAESRHIAFVSGRILVVATPPALFLGIAGLGWWTLKTALIMSAAALMLTLAVISVLAVRSAPLHPMVKMMVVAGELMVGTAIVLVETLAH